MSLPIATKNAALNGLAVDSLSLHSGWPGVTGANELAGGTPAYARKAVTLGASSGGQRLTSAAVTFDVPATTVRWIGLWNASTFVGAMANGGATPKNFVAMAATDVIASSAHGFSNGDKIAFFDGTPPGGLTEGTVYYVRDITADTFKVAMTPSGAPVDLSTGSSFGCVVVAVTEAIYPAQDTHQITPITVAVPD